MFHLFATLIFISIWYTRCRQTEAFILEAIGKIHADTYFRYLRLLSSARAQARYPLRAPNHAHAHYLWISIAGGHACMPAKIIRSTRQEGASCERRGCRRQEGGEP